MAKIEHAHGNEEWWICDCGNEPWHDGFFPCNADGRMVEPVAAEWDGLRYICNRCGVIIDFKTREIVGKGIPPHTLAA